MHGDPTDSIAEGGPPVELAHLGLGHGEGTRLSLPLAKTEISHGHETLVAEVGDGAVRLDVSRTTSGWAFRLRFTAEVHGRCVRCLEQATTNYSVEAREIEQPSDEDEELASPYVTEGVLDVGRWARDALALSLPQQFVCRPDCAGLCPECGVSLNDVDPAEHHHEKPRDPRFAILDKLRRE